MTDYHVIKPEAAELVMQVIDGQIVIVPPAPVPQTEYAGSTDLHRAAATAE